MAVETESTVSGGLNPKAIAVAGAAVFTLAAIVIVLSNDDRTLAIPFAIAGLTFGSVLPRWPNISKVHGWVAMIVPAMAGGWLASTSLWFGGLLMFACSLALAMFFGRRRKQLAAAAGTQ